MPNLQNLKPFTGVDDPRRQNGRPKGSKNLATIVKELEDENFDWSKIPTRNKNLSGSPWQAIVYTAVAMAIKGDIRAMEWLRRAVPEDGQEVLSQERFTREPLVLVDPELQTEEDKRAIMEAEIFDKIVYELTGRGPIIMADITPHARAKARDLEENYLPAISDV